MPIVNSTEYDHGDCEMKQDGVAYPFEEAEYSSPREVGEGHGNARMPQYRTKGRCTFDGKIKLRKHVWLAMRDALKATYGSVYAAKPTYTFSYGQGDDQTVDTLQECDVLDKQCSTTEGTGADMVTVPLKPYRILEDGDPPFAEAQ